MKISLAEQRDRLPSLPAVVRLDQTETRRKLVAQVWMARAEEAVGTDDGKNDRALGAIADTPRRSLPVTNAIDARVSSDEERTVAWINAERVNMAQPGTGRDLGGVTAKDKRADELYENDGGSDEENRGAGAVLAHDKAPPRAAATGCRLLSVPVRSQNPGDDY